jgi:hypothetical protein
LNQTKPDCGHYYCVAPSADRGDDSRHSTEFNDLKLSTKSRAQVEQGLNSGTPCLLVYQNDLPEPMQSAAAAPCAVSDGGLSDDSGASAAAVASAESSQMNTLIASLPPSASTLSSISSSSPLLDRQVFPLHEWASLPADTSALFEQLPYQSSAAAICPSFALQPPPSITSIVSDALLSPSSLLSLSASAAVPSSGALLNESGHGGNSDGGDGNGAAAFAHDDCVSDNADVVFGLNDVLSGDNVDAGGCDIDACGSGGDAHVDAAQQQHGKALSADQSRQRLGSDDISHSASATVANDSATILPPPPVTLAQWTASNPEIMLAFQHLGIDSSAPAPNVNSAAALVFCSFLQQCNHPAAALYHAALMEAFRQRKHQLLDSVSAGESADDGIGQKHFQLSFPSGPASSTASSSSIGALDASSSQSLPLRQAFHGDPCDDSDDSHVSKRLKLTINPNAPIAPVPSLVSQPASAVWSALLSAPSSAHASSPILSSPSSMSLPSDMNVSTASSTLASVVATPAISSSSSTLRFLDWRTDGWGGRSGTLVARALTLKPQNNNTWEDVARLLMKEYQQAFCEAGITIDGNSLRCAVYPKTDKRRAQQKEK